MEDPTQHPWSRQFHSVLATVERDPRHSHATDLVLEVGRNEVAKWSKEPGALRDLFSVTKTVIALLFGIAVADGTVTLADRPRIDPRRTFEELLSFHRMCSTEPPYDLDTIAVSGSRWASRFADAPDTSPGPPTFQYDDGCYQLVADDLHDRVGDLEDFAADRLFGAIGIYRWRWARDDAGVPSGPAHLALCAEDLCKLGTVLNGHWPEVVSPGWVSLMRTPTSEGGPPENTKYGRGIWLHSGGIAYGAGWAGQLLLCDPQHNATLVALTEPHFDYGPPPRDDVPSDWRSVKDLVLEPGHR